MTATSAPRAMTLADGLELTALAALWGASFLFMRLGAGEFGPVALSAVRVGGAALLLLPLMYWRGQAGDLRQHWRAILVVGVINSALPFLAYSYAALSITAGLSSIFNAADTAVRRSGGVAVVARAPVTVASVRARHWLWWRDCGWC